MVSDPHARRAAIDLALRSRQRTGGWIVCRGSKVGALTGLLLGAAFGTLALPVLGTAIGAVLGVVVGVVTGFVDAVALSALGPPADDRQSAWAASIAAALTAWPVPALLGYTYGLPAALAIGAAVGLSAVIGGVVGPYVVLGTDRAGRRAGEVVMSRTEQDEAVEPADRSGTRSCAAVVGRGLWVGLAAGSLSGVVVGVVLGSDAGAAGSGAFVGFWVGFATGVVLGLVNALLLATLRGVVATRADARLATACVAGCTGWVLTSLTELAAPGVLGFVAACVVIGGLVGPYVALGDDRW